MRFSGTSQFIDKPSEPVIETVVKRLCSGGDLDYATRFYFGHPSNAKSIIVLQKQTDHPMETFVYPIRDLKLAENIHDFMENFKNGN